MSALSSEPASNLPTSSESLAAFSRRRFLQLAAVLGVGSATASLLAACAPAAAPAAAPATGGSQAAGEPVRGGILKAAFSADPAGFDPVRGPSGMSHVVIEQVYSTLMALDPDATPYPELAESYEISEDGLTYTFKLRPNVTFHNGDPFTAEDVKFTFDRLRAPDSGYSYGAQVSTIESVNVLDPLTVEFKMTERTGPFLIYVAFPGSSIVPKALVESGHDLNAQPVGTGPFRFVSYEPRSMIRFERNETYFEAGKPYFDAMEYHIIADTTALNTALMTGVVNFSNEIPPKDWAALQANPDLKAVTLEGSRYNWMLLNNTVEPFTDARVRQAVSYALDREALVKGAFFGQATPILGGVIPEWNWAYAGDVQFTTATGEPEKGKALLAEAGYPDGFETSLTIASSFPAQMAMAPIIQANLEQIGIRATIETMEVPRYWDEVWGPSNFNITTMYWLSPLADPDDFVANNYGSANAGINVQKYASEAMDSLLAEGRTAPSQEARKEAYRQQQQLSMDDMPIVPLVNGWLLIGHTSQLQNYKPMRTG
ncbi:MAG: ABC transporter substrate-binding protein, partial [Caldilinea sp.]